MSRAGLATAVTARLVAAGVASGRVERARTTPHGNGAVYPRVDVYAGGGRSTSRAVNRAVYTTTWDLSVYCWAEAANDAALDDALDALRASVMAALSSDTTLRTSYRWPGEVRVTVEYDTAANTRRGRLEIACTAVEDESFQIAAVTDGDDLTTIYTTAATGATGIADDLDEVA